MVVFTGIDKEYLSGLHLFLECWHEGKEYYPRLTANNTYHAKLKDVKSLLRSNENIVFIRNNRNEANTIYVAACSPEEKFKDTLNTVRFIKRQQVVAYLPQLLSWPQSECEEQETFLGVMAACLCPDRPDRSYVTDRINKLYKERFTNETLGDEDFSQTVKLALGTIPSQHQANLSERELALYHAYVLYFFNFERLQGKDDLRKALKKAMGNALVAFHMNRDPSAFDGCWSDKANSKSSKNSKDLKDKCAKSWEDLFSHQYWADSNNLNVIVDFNSSKENSSDITRIEFLKLQLARTRDIDFETANDEQDNKRKSYELIRELIEAYDKQGVLSKEERNEGEKVFAQAINRFYAIDWQIINDLMGKATKQEKEQAKKRNKNEILNNLAEVVEAISQEEEDDDDTSKLVEQVLSICQRVLNAETPDGKKITSPESTTLLFFTKQHKGIIEQYPNLDKFLKEQLKQIQAGTYDDLLVALTSVILDELNKIKNSYDDIDAVYLKELTLTLKPSSLEYQEKGQVLALSYFSMMYGPLLQELKELTVGSQPLFELRIETKTKQKVHDESEGTDKTGKDVPDINDLINFVEGCAVRAQTRAQEKSKSQTQNKADEKAVWWGSEKTTKSEILECQMDLVFVFPSSSQGEPKKREEERSRIFTWEFNRQGIGSGLFLDVSHLLGINTPEDYLERLKTNQDQGSSESAEITTAKAEQADADNVLRHAYFNYNLRGIKGEYRALTLDDINTLGTLEEVEGEDKNSVTRIFFAQLDPDKLDLDLRAFIEDKHKEWSRNPEFAQHNRCLNDIEQALNEFTSSYRTTLWEFLQGKMNWPQVKVCAEKYAQLIKSCSDAHFEYFEKKDNKDDDNDFKKILHRLLRIGIADEQNVRQYKPEAIACPWHVEGLKTIALKNKRVVDFVRSIRAYAQDEDTGDIGVINGTDDRINLVSCNLKLFGQEGLIKLLQSPISLELVLLPNSDEYTNHAFLYRTQHCQGYALYEQSKLFSQQDHDHEYLLLSPILAGEMRVIREQFIRLLTNFESNNNEFNILFWLSPNYNLPLELFCDCLNQKDEKAKLTQLFAPYHHVTFYVVCDDENEQKLRLLYEHRLRSLKANQTCGQYIVNNKFSINLFSQTWFNKNYPSPAQEPFFDLCLCYDIFSAQAQDYNKGTEALRQYYDDTTDDELWVSDERFFPAFYNYQSYKAEKQCFLIAPFYTNTIKQTLRAFNILIRGSAEHLAVPYIRQNNEVFQNIRKKLESLHTHSSMVVTCDRLLKRKKFSKDTKGLQEFYFKQEGSIERNISITAQNDNICKQMLSRLNYLLKDIVFSDVNNPEQIAQMQQKIYDKAIELSGSIVLKAHQHNYICNEMVGLVLTRFVIAKVTQEVKLQHYNKLNGETTSISILVDDYVRSLGLDESNVADILTVEIIEQEEKELPFKVICFVAESKFYKALQPRTIERSSKQLVSTANSLACNFSGQHGDPKGTACLQTQEYSQSIYYDRELFRQRFAELLFEQENSTIKDFGKRIKKFLRGDFEVEIYAVSCCFSFAPDKDNNISFEYIVDSEGAKEASVNGVAVKKAQLCVEGKHNLQALLKMFNNQVDSKEFFSTLRSLITDQGKDGETQAAKFDQALLNFGLEAVAPASVPAVE